jgi:putative peptidoglycan lipid II flippase
MSDAPVDAPPVSSTNPGYNVARAAVMIASVTVVARIAGFARLYVFARTIGPSCLGDTYFTANTVPNIVFDIVAGGALTSLVVPVLARPVADGDRSAVDQTSSALLTWSATLLIPITVVGFFLTRAIMRLLVGNGHSGCSAADQVSVGGHMLAIFMPQIVLYGLSVILIGILQAHGRFLGPALGPLVSSLVVVTTYTVFGIVAANRENDLSSLTHGHELVLAVGTTLGVAGLLVPLVIPTLRLHLRIRPTYRFPAGVAATVAAMAISGAVVLGSSDLATAVTVRLGNARGVDGTVVLYTLAWAVFTVPWAVAAVPLATSAFPRLTASWQGGEHEKYADTAARSTRVLLVLSTATAAILVAIAGPAARVLVLGAPGNVPPTYLARGLATFAPGLVGYALVALCSRALYAQGNARTPAVAVMVGWSVTIVGEVVLSMAMPSTWTVAAFGIATSIGMTVSGLWLLVAVRRSAGPQTLLGVRTAGGAAVLAGVVAGSLAGLVALAAPVTGAAGDLVVVVVVALVAVVVHTSIVAVLDRPTLRMVLARGRLRRA